VSCMERSSLFGWIRGFFFLEDVSDKFFLFLLHEIISFSVFFAEHSLRERMMLSPHPVGFFSVHEGLSRFALGESFSFFRRGTASPLSLKRYSEISSLPIFFLDKDG